MFPRIIRCLQVVGMRLVFRQIHDHPEWNLIHSKTLREVVHINLRNHSRLHFVFSFQRRALFYECSLLMPLYIITGTNHIISFSSKNQTKLNFQFLIILWTTMTFSELNLFNRKEKITDMMASQSSIVWVNERWIYNFHKRVGTDLKLKS